LPRVFNSLEDMVRDVDAAIIHGVDWDTHVAKARPFIEAGKPVLIDKPFAGNVGDLRQIADWIRQGARITGGSALRFCGELRAWLDLPVEQRGTPHTAFVGCGVDEFNYGIHAYAFLSAIMGPGIKTVRHLGAGAQRRIQLKWEDGRQGILSLGQLAAWIPTHASVVTEKNVAQMIPDINRLYRSLLQSCLPVLAGESGAAAASASWLEPEFAAVAARLSWENGDREVALAELPVAAGYDGAAFAAGYRKAKYP